MCANLATYVYVACLFIYFLSPSETGWDSLVHSVSQMGVATQTTGVIASVVTAVIPALLQTVNARSRMWLLHAHYLQYCCFIVEAENVMVTRLFN